MPPAAPMFRAGPMGRPPSSPSRRRLASGRSTGTAPGLAYYYLWHFSAAVFGDLVGASGWEADIALTWFTAFASLTLMMGFAVRLSGRKQAAVWVVLLCLAASLRPVLSFALPTGFVWRALSEVDPPRSWIFQASWVPQHLASACCVVLAVYIMWRLSTPRSWPLVPLLSVLVAAGFESSTWVGGVVFAAAAVPIGLALLLTADDSGARLRLVAQAGVAVLVVVAISFPFLRDEYAATAMRQVGMPIALVPFPVLGPIVPDRVRHLLDVPAYWVVLLVVEFPAIYLAGTAAIIDTLAGHGRVGADRRLFLGFTLLAGMSFGIPWLFSSTIANNDLGWRGVLPGILVLTIFAATGFSLWVAGGSRIAAALAFACLALGIPDGVRIVENNATGIPARSAAELAETPELWAAVRRYAAPDERVANNPLFLADSVSWPVNISWALLANRRSCYASRELARAYVALPGPEIERINELFDRVFAGDAGPRDIQDLATRYNCRVVVVAASDGAWCRDPFADSSFYRLVDQKNDNWRIYRVVDAAHGPS
jgi:hypothetical protein